MDKSRSIIFSAAILLALFVGPRAGKSAETHGAKPKAENTVECQKKLTINGLPYKVSTVASLSALRAWAERAKKYGEEYAMWHNAKSSKIKCKKFPRSDYYMCFASGKPCRTTDYGPAGSKKSG